MPFRKEANTSELLLMGPTAVQMVGFMIVAKPGRLKATSLFRMGGKALLLPSRGQKAMNC